MFCLHSFDEDVLSNVCKVWLDIAGEYPEVCPVVESILRPHIDEGRNWGQPEDGHIAESSVKAWLLIHMQPR